MTQPPEILTTADRILALAQAEMPCPKCKGVGGWVEADGSGPPVEWQPIEVDCDDCHGSGTVPRFAELREYHHGCTRMVGSTLYHWFPVSQEKAGTELRKLEEFRASCRKGSQHGVMFAPIGAKTKDESFFGYSVDMDEATIAAAYQWAVSKGWV